MITIQNITALRQLLTKIMAQRKKIGLVPTMGALHTGHASLITQARCDNDFVIVSIFVNPTQFNEQSDYQAYPSTLAKDKVLLDKLDVDCLFLPEEKTMYPAGYDFFIKPTSKIASTLEGQARPGHFAGMLTVVMKLLMLIKPDYAYFGGKDYQQAVLVKNMVESFFCTTTIVHCTTKRETSGLPFSSRNTRLNNAEKSTVEQIYRLLKNDNFYDLTTLANKIKSHSVTVEYLQEKEQRIFLAIRIGEIRLIDNFLKATGPC